MGIKNVYKYTNEEFLKKAKSNKHIDVIGTYEGINNKILVRCRKCNKTSYKYPQKVLDGSSCVFCHRKATKNRNKVCSISKKEYLEKVYKTNPNIKIIGKFLGLSKKIKYRCYICGREHECRAEYLYNKIICPKCSKIDKLNILNEKLKKRNLTIIETFIDDKWNRVKYKCLTCGYEGINSYGNLNSDLTGCLKCGYKVVSEKKRKSHENFIKDTTIKDLNIEILSTYEGNNKNIKVKCLKCGFVYNTTPNQLLTAKTPCQKCCSFKKVSKGEEKIIDILNLLNVEYVYQKRFTNCKNIKSLIFDFYLPEYNTCVEYDGEFHYKIIYSEYDFLNSIKRDKIKDKFCKSNNINILRIPYFEFNNLENIIRRKLNLEEILDVK